VFEISSLMAVSAVRALPSKALWLSASARVGATHTRKLVLASILDDYSQTLNELRAVGYMAYAKRQLSPYVRACIEQFSPQHRTLTQRLLEKTRRRSS
jgi:hypothetical protein